MLEILELITHINDELDDATGYAASYLTNKDKNPELCKLYNKLSNEELTHSGLLHDQIVKFIEIYKQKNGEPPKLMLDYYNWTHDMQINQVAEIKETLKQ